MLLVQWLTIVLNYSLLNLLVYSRCLNEVSCGGTMGLCCITVKEENADRPIPISKLVHHQGLVYLGT